MECPNCGTEMEAERERDISVTFTGADGGEFEIESDDGEADVIINTCSNCGHTEKFDYTGDEEDGEGEGENETGGV